MAIVNEVVTQFAFQGSTQPLTDYNRSLGQSIGLLASAAAGVVAVAGAMGAFVTSTTKAIDPMIQLARATDVSVEAIQELSYAASVSGADAQALQSSISGLSEKIGEAAQKGSEDFARLGISVRKANGDVKSADVVLEELRRRFNALNLSMAERRSFAQALGIDPSLVQLLSKTGDEVTALRQKARDLGLIDEADADAAVRLNDAVTTLRFGFDALRNQIAVSLAPQIEDLTSGFLDFLAANKDVIADGISNLVEFVTALAASVVRLTPVIVGIAAVFGVWKVASIGLGAVLATVFSPVTVIVAGISALLLVIDDLIVAMNGGKSVIADFFMEFFGIDIVPPLNAALDAFKSFLSDFLSAGAHVFDVFSGLFKGVWSVITGDFDQAGEYFSGFFSDVVMIFQSGSKQVLGLLSRLADDILVVLTGMDMSGVGDAIADSIVNPIRDTFSDLFGWVRDQFSAVADAAGAVTDFLGFGDEDEDERAPQEQTTDVLSMPNVTVASPNVSPVDVTRRVNVTDDLRMPALDLKAMGVLSPDAQDRGRLVPTPPAPVNNTNSRSVTVEQSNQFTIQGEGGRRIADTVADRLQDQLDDARTQIDTGGY